MKNRASVTGHLSGHRGRLRGALRGAGVPARHRMKTHPPPPPP